MFVQYFAADVLQRLWSWILVEILKMKFNQDLGLNLWYDPIGYFGKMNSTLGSVVPLAMFGNTIGNKDRGEVIARTWFHSFFSRKKSEIWIAFTFFEKWKVKNKIPSLFFEKWKWNWNGSRLRTRSENEKKFSKILEKRESRWSLPGCTRLVPGKQYIDLENF